MSPRSTLWAVLGVVGLAVALSRCAGEMSAPTLSLSATPTVIGPGGTSRLTATATDSQGNPGTGVVRLSSTAGSLATPEELTLQDGTASTMFTCPASDSACRGRVVLRADWTVNERLVTATRNLTVDAGVPDAGPMDAGSMDAGPPDAGPRLDAGVNLFTDRTSLFVNVGDQATLTAVLAGVPNIAGETIDFTTSLGTFVLDGGTRTQMASLETDSTGRVSLRFSDTGVVGDAGITAQHRTSGTSARVGVSISNVASIGLEGSKCTQTTSNCFVLGLAGSGVNTRADVSYRVLDAQGRPAPGVRVVFSANRVPSGTTFTPEAVTDSQGLALCVVQAGIVTGNLTLTAFVNAMVDGGAGLRIEAPELGIRGGRGANAGFTMFCNSLNISAYQGTSLPRALTVDCTVRLADRRANAVGTSPRVALASEAGKVPDSITLLPWQSGAPSTREGSQGFFFETLGGTNDFPADTDPLPADPNQFPEPREAEPFVIASSLVNNPRDGLVTIMASTNGEEWFSDENRNGVYDPPDGGFFEQFIDQGEPFVDTNENDVHDTGEFFIDSNGNFRYDGPNGLWDGDTTIWTTTHILYTGAPSPLTATLVPSSGWTALRDRVLVLRALLSDVRFNRVEKGSTLTVRQTATKGSVSESNQLGLDSLGFRLDNRFRTADAGTARCVTVAAGGQTPQPSCEFRTKVWGWERGDVGTISVAGAPPSDTTPSQSTTVEVDLTVRGVRVRTTATGTIQ